MKIINKSKKTVIADDAINVKSITDKTLGLIKYSRPRALIMKTRFGIHTFGMRYAIDVMILDNKGCVVKTKLNLKPGNIFLWNPKYDRVFELPAGQIVKSKTETSDMVEYLE